MQIWAKSVLSEAALDFKLKHHVDGIELLLSEQFIEPDAETERLVKLLPKYPIRSIQPPKSIRHLEDLLDDPTTTIVRTLELANEIGKRHHHNINVVFHTESAFDDWFDRDDNLKAQLSNVLYTSLSIFQYVNICIENTIPYHYASDINKFRFSNNCLSTYIQLTSFLRGALGTDRIQTSFDVCNAALTERVFQQLFKIVETPHTLNYSLGCAFARNVGLCGEVHISRFKGSSQKGLPFKTVEEVSRILRLYDEYLPNVPIVLEVRERDYYKMPNFIQSRRCIKEYYKDKEMIENGDMDQGSTNKVAIG